MKTIMWPLRFLVEYRAMVVPLFSHQHPFCSRFSEDSTDLTSPNVVNTPNSHRWWRVAYFWACGRSIRWQAFHICSTSAMSNLRCGCIPKYPIKTSWVITAIQCCQEHKVLGFDITMKNTHGVPQQRGCRDLGRQQWRQQRPYLTFEGMRQSTKRYRHNRCLHNVYNCTCKWRKPSR